MKPMNLKKRIASTVLAGSMALSMTATAFAADPTTTITGAYTPITLAVTVPTTGRAIINPYGLPYKLDDTTSISGQYITTGAPLVIQNKSAVALSVSASVAGVEAGNFKFDADPVEDSETENVGNVVFQMFPAPGVSDSNVTDMDALNPLFAALTDDTEGHDAAKDIVVSKTTADNPAASQDDIIVLKQGNADGELQNGGAAFFRLSGTVAKKPTVAWTASDGFSAKVTFTFAPSTYAEEAGTIAVDGGGTASLDSIITTSAGVTLTPALPSGVTVTDWTWTSSNASVATVAVNNADNKKATVTRTGAGNATITVTGTDATGTSYIATIDFTCT